MVSVAPVLVEAMKKEAGWPSSWSMPELNTSTIMRGGSFGTYYPSHFDCFPNLLQTFVGNKNVMIFDQVDAWREVPGSYKRLTSLKNITKAAEVS